MPWKPSQFRAVMANTRDPNKRALYAAEQREASGGTRGKIDASRLSTAMGRFGRQNV